MFAIADDIHSEDIKKFEEILDIFTEAFLYLENSKPEPRKLVKITDQ